MLTKEPGAAIELHVDSYLRGSGPVFLSLKRSFHLTPSFLEKRGLQFRPQLPSQRRAVSKATREEPPSTGLEAVRLERRRGGKARGFRSTLHKERCTK